MQKQDFKKLFEHGPVILDGATGSNLMKAGMPKGVCTEKWVLEHPDTIIQLQRAYAEAGSQIIYAPTFAANRISLANHGLSGQVDHYNHALVALSKEAVQGKALIAGDITTTSKMDAEYDELLSAYEEQITALVDAGVDLLIAETMIGADETMAVIDAAHAVCDLPILCSLTMQADGSLFFGGNIFETAPKRWVQMRSVSIVLQALISSKILSRILPAVSLFRSSPNQMPVCRRSTIRELLFMI